MAPISPIVGDLSIQTGGGNSTDLLVQNIGVDGCTTIGAGWPGATL